MKSWTGRAGTCRVGKAGLFPPRDSTVLRVMSLLLCCVLLSAARAEAGLHWSFRPSAQPALPTIAGPVDGAWLRTSVDAFVLQRLHKNGLRPAPEADRATLI